MNLPAEDSLENVTRIHKISCKQSYQQSNVHYLNITITAAYDISFKEDWSYNSKTGELIPPASINETALPRGWSKQTLQEDVLKHIQARKVPSGAWGFGQDNPEERSDKTTPDNNTFRVQICEPKPPFQRERPNFMIRLIADKGYTIFFPYRFWIYDIIDDELIPPERFTDADLPPGMSIVWLIEQVHKTAKRWFGSKVRSALPKPASIDGGVMKAVPKIKGTWGP